MAIPPQSGPAATSAAAGLAAVSTWRWLAVAAPHLAALAIMLATEVDFSARFGFLLTWAFLNCFWIALLRRPALSGALSLTLVVVLILLSRLKHDIAQMTANFVDLMVIDRDTAAFLFTIFPDLRWSVIAAALVTLPLMAALWWLDPFRFRRLPSLACALGCLVGLVGYSMAFPEEAWRGYFDDGYVSKFARSGVTAVSDFLQYGYMESDAVADGHLKTPLVNSCHPTRQLPNIILIHDESSFDIRLADGVKVPAGYGSHFKSFDGKARKFLAEGNGGPSWFTEYNVLAGLSSRSFGRFAYFVTRIASGRVALSRVRRLHGCAQLPTHNRHPALLRCAGSRCIGNRARQFLLRQGARPDVKAFFQFAAVHLRLSVGQSLSLGAAFSSGPDAHMARYGQWTCRRRVSAASGDERERLCRVHCLLEEAVSG
jgi:hypothetical protein